MQSYFLKPADRAEGPYSEAQVSQLYADGRIDRHTPCRPATGGDWKTIDDFLPMLKYGTQLPASSPSQELSGPGAGLRDPQSDALPPQVAPTANLPPPLQSHPITLVDIDLPFVSILKLMFKWMAAAFLISCCFVPAVIVLIFIVTAIFGSLLGHMLSGFQHP